MYKEKPIFYKFLYSCNVQLCYIIVIGYKT